jgi:hypothetical protein
MPCRKVDQPAGDGVGPVARAVLEDRRAGHAEEERRRQVQLRLGTAEPMPREHVLDGPHDELAAQVHAPAAGVLVALDDGQEVQALPEDAQDRQDEQTSGTSIEVSAPTAASTSTDAVEARPGAAR